MLARGFYRLSIIMAILGKTMFKSQGLEISKSTCNTFKSVRIVFCLLVTNGLTATINRKKSSSPATQGARRPTSAVMIQERKNTSSVQGSECNNDLFNIHKGTKEGQGNLSLFNCYNSPPNSKQVLLHKHQRLPPTPTIYHQQLGYSQI